MADGQPDTFAADSSSCMSFRGFAARFAALFALAALPVLLNDNLPIYDYPNHLARMYLLGTLPTSPALQQYYVIDWQLLPNLAMDLIVPLLARLLPLAVAGKLFILLTLFLLAAGPALLHRVLLGHWSSAPLLAFLLLYGRILLWGYLNFLFGLGLALVLFAAWLALRSRPPVPRFLMATCFVVILYFAHFEALGIYGVLIVACEVQIAWQRCESIRQRLVDLAIAGLPFLVPLAILLVGTPALLGGAVEFSPLGRKFELMFTIFDAEDRILDFACFAAAVCVLAIALWRRWLSLTPEMKAPLAGLMLCYLVMPTHAFTASGADHRLPLAMSLALVASLRWTGTPEKIEMRIMSGAAILYAVRIAAILVSWHHSDRIYASLLPTLDAVPEGSRIAVAIPPVGVHAVTTPMDHFPTLAIIRRNAFVPTFFGFSTQQPVQRTPYYQDLAHRLRPELLWAHFVTGTGDIDDASLGCFDFIMFIARQDFKVVDDVGLHLIADNAGVRLYGINPRPSQPECARGR